MATPQKEGLRPVTAEVLPGYQTPLWGYNGGFPGPSFETTPGAPIYVKWTNDHYDSAVANSQQERREGR